MYLYYFKDGCDGLLGLSFLECLNLVEFDFQKKVLFFDPFFLSNQPSSSSSSILLSPIKKSCYDEISIKKLYTGLLVADCNINENSEKCTGLIDLGSTYTIFNGKAVEITKQKLEELPTTSVTVVGIDNNPINMRKFDIESIKIGDNHLVKSSSCYAANMAGFNSLGFGTMPSLIIGMDLLGNEKMMLDAKRNKLYLQKT